MMRCVKCGGDRSSVVDSRSDGEAIRRRRECQQCGLRFTTYERIELTLPMVVKKDGRREPFDRQKLQAGVMRACEKRPVSVEQIEETLDNVERALFGQFAKEIPSRTLGDLLMDELQKIDTIAYVRFASVYREFSDVNQFVDTLERLKGKEEQEFCSAESSNPLEQ